MGEASPLSLAFVTLPIFEILGYMKECVLCSEYTPHSLKKWLNLDLFIDRLLPLQEENMFCATSPEGVIDKVKVLQNSHPLGGISTCSLI